jgi:hypothetical protein
VVIPYEGLGTAQGKASLYVNGELVGHNGAPITEAFRWEPGQAATRLGVNYVGWMGDLAAYSRALTAEEVRRLQ